MPKSVYGLWIRFHLARCKVSSIQDCSPVSLAFCVAFATKQAVICWRCVLGLSLLLLHRYIMRNQAGLGGVQSLWCLSGNIV